MIIGTIRTRWNLLARMPPRLLGIAFFVVLVWMMGSPQQPQQCEDGVSLVVHGLVMPLRRIPQRSSLVLFSNNNNNNNNNPLDTSWTVTEDDPNDPRVMRRMRREQQQQQNDNKNQKKKKDPAAASSSSYRQARSQVSKQQQASAAFDLPQQPVVKTIGGGTAMIFAMARRMWEQERADDSSTTTPNTNNNNNNTPKNNPQASTTPTTTTTTSSSSSSWTVPRWRPTATQTVGISNFNPEFRTQSPPMNSQGYASTIWRNVRKRNKPSLWRHALRLYDRMEEATTTTTPLNNNKNKKTTTTTVPRTNEHYHGALLAAAKLGLWEKAMEIFDEVQERQAQQEQFSMTLSSSSSLRKPYSNSNRGGLQTSNNNMINNGLASNSNNNKLNKPSSRVHVTDYMVVSVLYACVRASRNHQSSSEDEDDDEPLSIQERRQPLDAARDMLEQVSSQYDLILCQRHVNPLAAAYLQLRLRSDAQDLLQGWLKDRQIGPEPEDGVAPFNINDIGTKDKASYTLLVTGAVQDDDWTGAVQALSNMTRAGLYPTQRHLNAWNEVSERKTKHRTTRSWKKKRDELWIERGLR